jgi:N utilization substance protein A
VQRVDIDEAEKTATVVVPERQLSLAIGREGQNARLAARLTGWRIDIKSDAALARAELEAWAAGGTLGEDGEELPDGAVAEGAADLAADSPTSTVDHAELGLADAEPAVVDETAANVAEDAMRVVGEVTATDTDLDGAEPAATEPAPEENEGTDLSSPAEGEGTTASERE